MQNLVRSGLDTKAFSYEVVHFSRSHGYNFEFGLFWRERVGCLLCEIFKENNVHARMANSPRRVINPGRVH